MCGKIEMEVPFIKYTANYLTEWFAPYSPRMTVKNLKFGIIGQNIGPNKDLNHRNSKFWLGSVNNFQKNIWVNMKSVGQKLKIWPYLPHLI